MRILIILSLALSALAYGWIHQEINVSPNYSSKNSCSAISTKNTELSETQFLSSTQLNFVCDRKSDSLELVKFYNAMGGPNWTVRWDLNKSMSTWFGITLDFDGCVMWINFENGINQCCIGNNLKGSLYQINLPNLNFMDLADNQIEGSIPNFNFLPMLVDLTLFNNKISGAIPNFNKLPNLKFLLLFANKLSGMIPEFEKSPDLLYIDVNYNNLSGLIPRFENHLKDLDILNYSINNFTFNSLISNNQANKLLVTLNNKLCPGCDGDTLEYAPQFNVYYDTSILIQNNTPYTLDLLIDDTVTTSIYTWYKNGILYKNIKGSNKLPFTPFTSADAGTYTVKITNPLAPQLTLESWPIRLNAGPSLVCDRRSDSLELVKFYNATGGPNWTIKWDLSKAMNTWYGISLSTEGCVQKIDFKGISNNLSGILIQLNLSQLTLLDLGWNQLTGSIPNFDKLPNLRYLALSRNQLTGSIPNFDKLSNLLELDLFDNQLTGILPDHTLTNPKLNRYWIYQNKLTFSSFIRNIKKVKNLTDVLNKGFFSNDTLIYAPQKMIYVDTSIYIPINASYTLDLLIDDTVTTSTYTWYKNGILYKTIKGSNKLTFNPFTTTDAGTYTVMITNPLAPQLTLESWPIRLNAGPSLVCDRRSDSLELKKFYDSTGGANWFTKWNLSEPMDKWWGIKLSPTGCVTEINMRESRPNNCCDGNNLNGSLPDLNLSALELLHCQNNTSLKGQIPNFNLPNLMEMSLPTCSLSGPIPIFDKLPKLKILNLNRNNLSDTLPDFKNLNNLEVLNLGTNSISGKIPDFPSFQKLINLELYSNLLTGPIPNFSSLNNLNLLYLQSNQLSGTIPNFTNLRSLMFLGLDNNKLTGHLPSFEFSKNLKVVGITNNLLNGLFPNYSGFTPALTSMTIDRNCYTFSGLAINIVKTQELTQKNVLPGCQCPDSLVYHPQKKIYVDTTITIPSCTDYTLDLKIDDTVTSSIYSWFKDGVPFNTRKGSNKLPFIGFNSTNAGTYTVKITNPFAPQLTLESHPIRLISSGTAPQINNPRDTALSCGSFYILPTLKGINLTGNGLYFSGPGKSGMSYKPGDKIISTTTLYAFDGSGSCFDEDTFTISFSIKPAFILKPDQYKVPYNQSILFDVLANDFIPPGLNVMVVIDNPVHGKSFYSQTLGKGTYTPDLGYIGKEILKYKVCPVSCPNVCDSSTVEFDVLPPCSDRNSLVLPNVIFPDGPSNDNRYFIVQALIDCPDDYGPKPTKLTVFNRWGDLVYRNDAYINDWAGTNTQGQPLPTGTYYYLLDLGSVSAPIKGYVVIMR